MDDKPDTFPELAGANTHRETMKQKGLRGYQRKVVILLIVLLVIWAAIKLIAWLAMRP